MEIDEFIEQDILVFLDERLDKAETASAIRKTASNSTVFITRDYEKELNAALDKQDLVEAKKVLAALKQQFDECPTGTQDKQQLKALLIMLYDRFKDQIDVQNSFAQLDTRAKPAPPVAAPQPIAAPAMPIASLPPTPPVPTSVPITLPPALSTPPTRATVVTPNTPPVAITPPIAAPAIPVQEKPWIPPTPITAPSVPVKENKPQVSPAPMALPAISVQEIKPSLPPMPIASTPPPASAPLLKTRVHPAKKTVLPSAPIIPAQQKAPPRIGEPFVSSTFVQINGPAHASDPEARIIALLDAIDAKLAAGDIKAAISAYKTAKDAAAQSNALPKELSLRYLTAYGRIKQLLLGMKKESGENTAAAMPDRYAESGMDQQLLLQLEAEKRTLDKLLKQNDIAGSMVQYKKMRLLAQQIHNPHAAQVTKEKLALVYSIIERLRKHPSLDERKLVAVP